MVILEVPGAVDESPVGEHTVQSVRDRAQELIATLERDTARSTGLSLRHARVRLTPHGHARQGHPRQGHARQGHARQGQPILAEASAEFDGRRIRAQVAAATALEAIDILDRVLRHRMSWLARRWEAGLDAQLASASHAWRHSAEETHRPEYLPLPIRERKVMRHKAFELELCTADEAIVDMELMGYPFQLFKGLESGQDSFVYRQGQKGYRLAQVEPRTVRNWGSRAALTVSPHPALRMSLAEATECLNLTGGPFVFYADTLTDGGRVLYRRYDGHYSLITRVDA